MLLEFKTKNYKSFVEEASFSMVAAPKQKGLDYSLMKTKIKGKEIKGLSSSVIYGPNAAGKTNIIGAMDVLRAIVLRGNIRNSEEKSSPNPAAAALELIPNNNEMESKPVCFEIEFYEEDGEDHKFKIHYELEVDLGTFLEEEHQRKILAEVLEVNGERVFERTQDLKIENLKVSWMPIMLTCKVFSLQRNSYTATLAIYFSILLQLPSRFSAPTDNGRFNYLRYN